MKTQRIHQRSLHHQNGSVLMWGMIILLTLTVIGITAARMGVTDTRIAGNQMFGMMTYQGSESTLEKVTTLFHIEETESEENKVKSWSFPHQINRDPDNPGDIKTVNSVATVSMKGGLMCTGQEGFAMSMEMTSDVGGLACLLYTVNAQAQLPGSGARSQHEQGILKYVPATGQLSKAVDGGGISHRD